MQYGQTSESPLQRFMKTIHFRILLLILLALATGLIIFGVGCLALVIAPLLVFGIPYWLKERQVKNFLLNGIVVFIIAFFVLNGLQTAYILSSAKPDMSAESGGFTLSHGTVDPYVGGTSSYKFSVIYSSDTPVNATDVTLHLKIFEYNSQSTQERKMIANTSGLSTQGWTFVNDTTLSEGVYFFNFTATTNTSSGKVFVSTGLRLGPLNAPWTTYFSTWMVFVMLDILLAFFLYAIILGVYWWSQRMKTIRGPMMPPAKTEAGGEFECTNCGADVSEDATKCPRCGAVFEEEPVMRAKKVEKEKYSVSGAKDQDKERKETR